MQDAWVDGITSQSSTHEEWSKIVQNPNKSSAAYNEMFHMSCETFEETLTAIGPVITKTADRKPILNAWSNEKKLSSTIMKNLNTLKINDS